MTNVCATKTAQLERFVQKQISQIQAL